MKILRKCLKKPLKKETLANKAYHFIKTKLLDGENVRRQFLQVEDVMLHGGKIIFDCLGVELMGGNRSVKRVISRRH